MCAYISLDYKFLLQCRHCFPKAHPSLVARILNTSNTMLGLRILLAALVAGSASASPAAQATDLGVADIINALGVGLVKDINAFVTVSTPTDHG